MKSIKNTLQAFSIIEVLIGIFVFSLGLISIYALLASSLSVSDYNRNSIIASNLAREQIELFRNIRDTNYKKLQVWNQLDPDSLNYSDVFLSDNYYTLENNINTGNIDVRSISDPSSLWVSDIFDTSNIAYGRLCLDSENRYIYCTWGGKKQKFAKFLHVKELEPDSFQITSKVIWYKRGYYEYEIQTIVTDWRRI